MRPWPGTVKVFAVCMALGAALTGAAIAAPESIPAPIIRTEINPRQAMVGQTVTLKVDVLVPSWFTAPIDYPATISVAGVTAQLSNSAAINLNERIDNQSYAGMSKLYSVVAQQAGEFKLPAMPVKISYAVDGAARTMTLHTTTQSFHAALPAGAENLGYFFATPNYSLKQTTDRPLQRLKVGDAIVRRITQRAEGVAAMNLPGLSFAEFDGVSSYPAEAQLEDSGGERGKVRVGERVDAVTYILRNAGSVELPGLRVAWFDIGTGKMRWSNVPALRFEVAPDPHAATVIKSPLLKNNSVSPAPTGEITLRTKQMRVWHNPATLPMLGGVIGLLLLAFLLKRQGIQLLTMWRKWRVRRRDAEQVHFKRCIADLRNADATKALNATLRWLNHHSPSGSGASLTRFAAKFGDEKFRQQVAHQQLQLFAKNMAGYGWDTLSFQRSLIAARQRWLRTQRSTLRAPSHLPSLNPVHDAVN